MYIGFELLTFIEDAEKSKNILVQLFLETELPKYLYNSQPVQAEITTFLIITKKKLNAFKEIYNILIMLEKESFLSESNNLGSYEHPFYITYNFI